MFIFDVLHNLKENYMKLNNKTIWLTGEEFESGIVLKALDFKEDNNHVQSKVYYKDGIYEINSHFYPSDYIDKGYNCSFFSNLNGFTIAFLRIVNGNPVDLAYGHIKRSQIEKFEEKNMSNLKVEKNEEGKHMIKNIARKGFAGASVVISSMTDSIVNVNTHLVDGAEYKLYYKSIDNKSECLTFYAPNEFKNEVSLFLNTYYKKDLPEQAKTPIKSEEDSKCFIATACYRDIFSEEVIFFRNYRDNNLKKSLLGKLFIYIYYKVSPCFYNILFNNPNVSKKVKRVLDRIYIKLKNS